jgi:hypothetical protein
MGKLADQLRKEAQEDNKREVARLVGGTNDQMNPTRTTFSDAVSANQADSVERLEEAAADFLRRKYGTSVATRTGLGAEAQKQFPRLSDAAAIRVVKRARG